MGTNFQKISLAFILFLFVFLVGSTFFSHPIYIWDEAIYANNALEMSHSHNAFVMTLDHQPNLYNTKPPLGIWLMAISIKLFGANEFAVRLPSVLAFLGVIVIILRFSKKIVGSYGIGVFACLVLLGSKGLLISHGVRSGDLDSLLLLCTTSLALGSFSLFLDNNNSNEKTHRRRELIKLAGITLVGFLIKSTAILLLLPGLAICLSLSENRMVIVKEKYLYLLTILLFVLIVLYYVLMHFLHPGYNRQVFFSEYKRIYSDIMPWHKQPTTWYLYNLINGRFTPFIFFLVPAMVLGFFSTEKIIRRVSLFSAITAGFFLLIISLVPDKLEWYDLPVYPLFALMIGIGIWEGIKRVSALAGIPGKLKVAVFWICILILSIPALTLRKEIMAKDILHDLEKESYCIRQVKKDLPDIKNITVLMKVENPLHRLSLDFYRKAYQDKMVIKTAISISDLRTGDTVLCSQENKMDSLRKTFTSIDTVSNFKYGKLFIIH
jgi:4-amino-4-deoxy-L-arabinose transferase-like glycosyltransferase